MDDLVLALEQHCAKIVEKALPRVVIFEHLDEFLRCELLGILARNLHDELQILAHVGAQQVVHTLDRVFHGQGTEELDELLGLHELSATHRALDVVDVLIVLHGTLYETRLLAQHRYAWPIVVCEHVVRHDRICDLRRCHQIHLEQTRL